VAICSIDLKFDILTYGVHEKPSQSLTQCSTHTLKMMITEEQLPLQSLVYLS